MVLVDAPANALFRIESRQKILWWTFVEYSDTISLAFEIREVSTSSVYR
jgi:hypothetical protein